MTWVFDTAAIALSSCNIFPQLTVASWLQFSIFKLFCLVFVRYYLSSRTALENCVLFVIAPKCSWENFFAETRFVLPTQAINLSRGSASVQCRLYGRTEYPLSQALAFFTQTSVSYWTLLLCRKSYTCISTAVQSFWAAVNAGKLLNIHVLELFVNYMTILTASMGT